MSKAGVINMSGSCRGNTHTGMAAHHFLETVINFARLFAHVEKIQDLLTTAEKAVTSCFLHRKEK
jgi:hypothetical protein